MLTYKQYIYLGEQKIRSYQTLVYKNGSKTFRKKDYKAYEQLLMDNGMEHMKEWNTSEWTYYEVSIHFILKGKRQLDLDNMAKAILDIMEQNNIISNDKYIYKLELSKALESATYAVQIEIKGDGN